MIKTLGTLTLVGGLLAGCGDGPAGRAVSSPVAPAGTAASTTTVPVTLRPVTTPPPTAPPTSPRPAGPATVSGCTQVASVSGTETTCVTMSLNEAATLKVVCDLANRLTGNLVTDRPTLQQAQMETVVYADSPTAKVTEGSPGFGDPMRTLDMYLTQALEATFYGYQAEYGNPTLSPPVQVCGNWAFLYSKAGPAQP